MHANQTTGELLTLPGVARYLREHGVLLDAWDQLLSLAELCAEYHLDTHQVLGALQQLENNADNATES